MTTQAPEFLSLEGQYASYRPSGVFSFDETVAMIDHALVFCRDHGIHDLLVDITGVSGFPPPTTLQRFNFATRWADTAGGRVNLSMLAPPHLIDPDRIGVTMAVNRGLHTDVFTSEPDAVNWLLFETH